MKILIITAYFPPENSIASLRPYSWAKWWSRAGHEVTVLTTTKPKRKNDLNLDCSFFKIISVPVPILSFISKCSTELQETNEAVEKRKKFSVKQKILTLLKFMYSKITATGCFNTCRFPDWHDLWIKKVAKLLEPSCCDLLVTTGGPYSVHRTASLLQKKGWKGKWICDWRDLWTKNHLFHGIAIFRPWERHLEKLFHKNADYITTVSEHLADTLREMTNTPVEVIYNGFDTEDFEFLTSRTRKNNEKYIISYLGTVYRRYRDPEPLFQGLGELDKEGLISPNDIVVQFAGGQADVSDLAQKYGIEKYYKYLGFLPREKSLELQYDSDAVLFLEYENPNVKGVLTGKLFEYLYLSRKIIAVGCSNNTSAGELIEKCNAGLCFGHDVAKIKEYILGEINKKKEAVLKSHVEQGETSHKNIDDINVFSRKLQAEKMISLILPVSVEGGVQ